MPMKNCPSPARIATTIPNALSSTPISATPA